MEQGKEIMTELGQSFIDNTMQCWSCPIFDRVFQIISQAAGVAYKDFVIICTVLFFVIFGFYIFSAVWKNMTEGFKDGWINNSLRPIFINSMFVLAFLGMGAMLPRFITTITFEPVAQVTETYAAAMMKLTPEVIEEHVTYEAPDIDDSNGIFRQELRDSVINTAKVTITLFQSLMKLGVAMIDAGLTWSMFFGIGAFIKHIILTIIGVYLFMAFFKMFFKFLCYFADVIIAMAMFAFFFPLSLVTAAFKEVNDKDMPSWLSWIKTLGKGVGVEQFQNVLNAIVSLGVAVITYTVILVIIAKFFADPDGNVNNFEALLAAIMDGDVFELDLDNTGLNDLTITSVVVLIYVLTFIYDNIPKITEMVLGMFGINSYNYEVGEKLGDSLLKTSKLMVKQTKDTVKTIAKHVSGK